MRLTVEHVIMKYSFPNENDEPDTYYDHRLREGLEAAPVKTLRCEEFDWKVMDALRPRTSWTSNWLTLRPAAVLAVACLVVLAMLGGFMATHFRQSVPLASVASPPASAPGKLDPEWLVGVSMPHPEHSRKHSPPQADAGLVVLH